MRCVLFYETAPDAMPVIPIHFPAHSERTREFHARGTLLMTGPFANPMDGAMSVFTTRESAEEFIAGDPFVLNGVVSSWRIADWNEAFSREPVGKDGAGSTNR